MQPLAERLRPQTLDDYIGQTHLVGPGAVIRRMIEQKRVSSFILWGPPGVGKTTLAHIISKTLEVPFFTLSAVTSGVKDVREVIEKAKPLDAFNSDQTRQIRTDPVRDGMGNGIRISVNTRIQHQLLHKAISPSVGGQRRRAADNLILSFFASVVNRFFASRRLKRSRSRRRVLPLLPCPRKARCPPA